MPAQNNDDSNPSVSLVSSHSPRPDANLKRKDSQLSARLHRGLPLCTDTVQNTSPSESAASVQFASGRPQPSTTANATLSTLGEKHSQPHSSSLAPIASAGAYRVNVSNSNDNDVEAGTDTYRGGVIPPSGNFRTYFMQQVAHNYFLEGQLLFLTVGTGIIDAMTFVHYNCFVSKQTGNAIFIALWANRHSAITGGIETNVAFSMLFFIIGAALFGHAGHLIQQRRRIWLLISQIVQCSLVFAAAAIRRYVSAEKFGAIAAICVSLLSMASGGQISLALCVRLPELNTTMITGCLIQLVTDRNMFALHNVARNRRLLFFLSLLAGAFIGAAAIRYCTPTLAVLLFGIVKSVVALSFLFNHGMMDVKAEVENSGTATPLTKILWGD